MATRTLPDLIYLVLGLSWAYAHFRSAPGVTHLVVGLDGIVVGVMASFVGLLATVVISLSHQISGSPAALGLAAAGLAAVRVFRCNLALAFVAGLGAWVVYLVLGGPVLG